MKQNDLFRPEGSPSDAKAPTSTVKRLGSPPFSVEFINEGIVLVEGDEKFFVSKANILHLNIMLELYSQKLGRSM